MGERVSEQVGRWVTGFSEWVSCGSIVGQFASEWVSVGESVISQ